MLLLEELLGIDERDHIPILAFLLGIFDKPKKQNTPQKSGKREKTKDDELTKIEKECGVYWIR